MKVRWGHVRLQPHRFVQVAQFQPDRAPQVDGHDFLGIDFERLVTVAERRLEIRQPLLPGIQLQVDHPPAGQGGAFAFRTEGFSTIYQWRSLAASFWKYWIDVR